MEALGCGYSLIRLNDKKRNIRKRIEISYIFTDSLAKTCSAVKEERNVSADINGQLCEFLLSKGLSEMLLEYHKHSGRIGTSAAHA